MCLKVPWKFVENLYNKNKVIAVVGFGKIVDEPQEVVYVEGKVPLNQLVLEVGQVWSIRHHTYLKLFH